MSATSQLLSVLLLTVVGFLSGRAQSLLGRDEALRLYFPPPATVQRKTAFLTPEHVVAIEQRAMAKVDSRILTYYVAKDSSGTIGYAFIETRIVRTLPQTFLVVVKPDGTLQGVELLAFSEPEDYRPPVRWLETFRGRLLTHDLWLKRGVPNIIGATITAESITRGVRKILATFEIAIAQRN